MLDTSSIEIFIDDGIETISSRFYILGENLNIEIKGIDKLISKELRF